MSLMTERERRNTLAGYLFIGPWLLGFLGLTLLPILGVFYLSFTSYDIFTPPRWIGLRNFARMFFEDPRYWNSVRYTLYFAIVSVPMKLVFALMIAMLLNTKHRLIDFYRAVYYTPSILGTSVAVAVMWREIFGFRGLVNSILMNLGILSRPFAWLGEPSTAIWTLILLVVWQFGSPMLIFLAGLKQIPTELYESAHIDGAGGLRKFWNITLPLLSPVIFFNLIMQIIFGLTVFTQPFVITQGGPLDTTNFYALYMYRRAFETFQMGYAAALALVLLLVVAATTSVVFKTSARWVFYESKEGKL